MKKQDKKLSPISVFLYLFPKFFKCIPWLLSFFVLISALHGLSLGIIVTLNQNFYDSALNFAQGAIPFDQVLITLIIMILGQILNQLLNGVANYMPNVMDGITCGHLKKELHQKMGRLSPEFFEDTAKLDKINLADMGRWKAYWLIFRIVILVAFYVPYFAYMGSYLFSLKPILLLSLVLVFVPTAITQIARAKMFSDLEDKLAPIRRENDYYRVCANDRCCYKETRLLGAFGFFKDRYVSTLKALQQLTYKINVKASVFDLCANMLTLIGYCGILWMLFQFVMSGDITVGAFVAVFTSIGTMYGIMEEMMWQIKDVSSNIGAIQNYVDFLKMPIRQGEKAHLPQVCDIKLDAVSFAYPQSDKLAVDNVTLTVPAGKTIAIVGENGSGKSTLVRLMTGIYLPSQGTVTLGDFDTSKTDVSSLAEHTSAVFQHYKCYQMTLRDNVSISNTHNPPNDEGILAACHEAGAVTEGQTVPNGLDTMLSREFEGVDLSGGQWQRVAIARGLYKKHGFIVLDEPTAAIDPLEESRIYNRFAEISKGKTAIIVTHRLGSVKLADTIAVMKEGKLVQLGSHDELLADVDGEYARLYRSQEQWYVQEA